MAELPKGSGIDVLVCLITYNKIDNSDNDDDDGVLVEGTHLIDNDNRSR